MFWITICWPALMSTFARPSARRSVVTFLNTVGGRPPRELLLGALASAPLCPLRYPFVVIRITSMPLVRTIYFSAATRASLYTIMTAYDKRPDEALASLVSTLPSEETVEPAAQLDEAHAERQLLWHSVIEGTEYPPQDLPVSSLRHGRGITPDDGDGDDEDALARKRMDVHRVIAASVDKCVREGLLQTHMGARARGSCDPCDSGGQHGRSGPNPPCGTSSGSWVILPRRLGTLHEFTDTKADRRKSGSGHE